MSAWMITDDHADFLASAYVRLIDPTADPQAIGQELLYENHFSLAARYGVNDFSQAENYQFREFGAGVSASWVNKNARCADYQCCEHEGWSKSKSCSRLIELVDATGGPDLPFAGDIPWGIEAEHRAKETAA